MVCQDDTCSGFFFSLDEDSPKDLKAAECDSDKELYDTFDDFTLPGLFPAGSKVY